MIEESLEARKKKRFRKADPTKPKELTNRIQLRLENTEK